MTNSARSELPGSDHKAQIGKGDDGWDVVGLFRRNPQISILITVLLAIAAGLWYLISTNLQSVNVNIQTVTSHHTLIRLRQTFGLLTSKRSQNLSASELR